MLTSIRKHTQSFVVKLLAFMLIISFAIWGIDDMIRVIGTDSSAAIKVAGIEVGAGNVANQVQREIDRLRPILGNQFGPEEAKALGLVDSVIQRIVSDTALLAAANQLGVAISDDLVRDAIQQTPAFKGPTGFDHGRFQLILNQNKMTEADYIAEVRAQMARNHLLSSFGVRATPKLLAETIYRHRQEKRIAETVFFADSVQQIVAEPDAAQLEKFHKDRTAQFTAPEYRALTVVRIDAADLAAEVNVTDAELKTAYESREDEFNTPETRHVMQMILAKPEDADAALKELTEGKTFQTVAKEKAGMDASLVDLGVVTRAALPFPEMADAVFALEKDKPSAPIKTPLGWHVFKVTDIRKGEKKTFEEARDALRKAVSHEKAVDSLYGLANRFEDSLGSGATIEDTAKKLNLKVVKIAAIDSTGHDPAGKKMENLPAGNFLETAFSSEQGANSQLTDTGQDGYFILRVDTVTPPALKPLETVRHAVIDAWKREKRAEMAKTAAEAVVARIHGGAVLDIVAKEMGLAVKTTPPTIRVPQADNPDLSPALIGAIFATTQGKAVMVRDETGYIVARLKEIIPADPAADAGGVGKLANELAEQLENDVLTELADALRERHGATVNRKRIDDSLSGSATTGRPTRQRR
jgi:peptidyl-prolyl cis-trans isomerase D